MNPEMKRGQKLVAWRKWDWLRTYYVEALPGQGGADWGYTTDPAKALPLSFYWQRRFNADCNRVGAVARFRSG